MAKPYAPPTGRLSTKERAFEEVVRDVRHTVFSVIRLRPTATPNVYDALVLGSGFFVSPTVFLTCYHVVNPTTQPHQDGDSYRFVSNPGGNNASPVIHDLANVTSGTNLYLHQDADLALFQFQPGIARPFVALEYGATPEGRDIGVAGYPLGAVSNIDGIQAYKQLTFRVAKGVVNACYEVDWTDEFGTLNGLPVIEVNFMFLPGNSGGPVFDARTGRVAGFVKGFNYVKIVERAATVANAQGLPDGLGPQYIEHLHALRSFAIKMERARPHLEALGVAL